MTDKLLSELTTAAVGGPARLFVEATSEQEIIEAVNAADQAGEGLLVVGGGSNLLVADEGFDGAVVHIASTGIETVSDYACGGTTLRVQAGHTWDDLVAYAVEQELSGLEALSGIPGTVGATPVQNVGAYGSEVAHTIASVRTWDRQTGSYKTFANADLKFAYRDSILKQSTVNGSPRYVVLTVDFQLPHGSRSAPVRYAELARQLGVEVGERADSRQVRETVLRLRAGKGMVLDAADRDTYSTGSFFTNPIVGQDVAAQLPEDAPRYPATTPTGEPLDGMVKLSAAWLIQHAGFDKGFGLEGEAAELAGGRASLSTKHTLAITNRGGASTSDIAAIARAVRAGVEESFGVRLVPEPVVVGFTL
ncbi:MAG: UDP-N-acetylmuramate dehydrogenase [Rothia sp. (in: high G+C Gram-positive bacteria)]|uniref:UDP-N-acetylmuramate dehydrogenase n=1 Tax=Rothia sp. (in: high G+C Gram-positive bacteria) TaxID=1885016 RepID=UPI00270F8330|nr:UDP-N-acetylmuramate dehydrogenase [Rothia sp. (in: high G+C Gram-positive bacteria)]